MGMTIRSGPATVIASGEVTTFGGQPLRFELPIGPDGFAVEMGFASDPHADGVTVHTEHLDGGLRFRLVNFDHADGRGSSVPVLLGEVEEQLLFMHFRVWRWGRTEDRTVHYTFFVGDKDALDWRPS